MLDVETLTEELREKLDKLLDEVEVTTFPGTPNSVRVLGAGDEIFSICKLLDPGFGPYGVLYLRGIREYMIERMVD